jgi:hypothetical protein
VEFNVTAQSHDIPIGPFLSMWLIQIGPLKKECLNIPLVTQMENILRDEIVLF